MNIDILIPAISALILLAAMHGVFIKWHNAHGTYKPLEDAFDEKIRQANIKRWSKLWHRLAMGIRTAIFLIVWLNGRDWLTTSIVIVATAIEYNISINLINNLKWYFVGTTANTDILIRKLFPKIKW